MAPDRLCVVERLLYSGSNANCYVHAALLVDPAACLYRGIVD